MVLQSEEDDDDEDDEDEEDELKNFFFLKAFRLRREFLSFRLDTPIAFLFAFEVGSPIFLPLRSFSFLSALAFFFSFLSSCISLRAR